MDTTEIESVNDNPHSAGSSLSLAWEHGWSRGKGDKEARSLRYYSTDEEAGKAWQDGYDHAAGKYIFDPTTIDTVDDPNVKLAWSQWTTKNEHGSDVSHYGFYVVWHRNFNLSADDPSNERPLWADIHIRDRVWREVSKELAIAMTRSNMANWKDLGLDTQMGCPPYEYEAADGNLTIRSGMYHMTGTKSEWESVLAEMQAAVDDMPEGIDISNQYLVATGTVSVEFSVNTSLSSLLDGDDQMDGDLWMGTEDELSEAASESFEENAQDYISEADLDITYSGVDNVDINDSYVE